MTMCKMIRDFGADEDGAVAVDWVVLTAGIVAVNLAVVMGIIIDGVETNANYIDEKVDEAVINF